jgi:hypothetical protein
VPRTDATAGLRIQYILAPEAALNETDVAVAARFADWLGINQDLDFQPNIDITSIFVFIAAVYSPLD